MLLSELTEPGQFIFNIADLIGSNETEMSAAEGNIVYRHNTEELSTQVLAQLLSQRHKAQREPVEDKTGDIGRIAKSEESLHNSTNGIAHTLAVNNDDSGSIGQLSHRISGA